MKLIEIIFSNPILIVLLIMGLSQLGKRKKDTGRKAGENRPLPKQTPKPIHRPISTSPTEREQFDDLDRKRQEESYEMTTVDEGVSKQVEEEKLEPVSIDKLRQQQLEQLTEAIQEQFSSYDNEDLEEVKEKGTKQISEIPKTKQIKHNHFTGRITKEGLIDSIIMKEVLDRPRALRPYQSHPMRRN